MIEQVFSRDEKVLARKLKCTSFIKTAKCTTSPNCAQTEKFYSHAIRVGSIETTVLLENS